MGSDYQYLHAPLREQVFCLWKHVRKSEKKHNYDNEKDKREEAKGRKVEEGLIRNAFQWTHEYLWAFLFCLWVLIFLPESLVCKLQHDFLGALLCDFNP